MCKIISAIVFIITVVSFGKYAFAQMIPFIFYPILLAALSETPNLLLLKRCLLVVPFCLFVGIFGLFLEPDTAFVVGNIAVSFGMVAFATLIYRTYLCVTAILILIAVTPFTDLTSQMRLMKIPDIFVIMFEMTYRYISILFEEAVSMYTAYSLRTPHKNGVDIRNAGSFVGHLLLRSFDRAERIYSAMKCRGYILQDRQRISRPPKFHDIVYCVSVCLLCGLLRIFDIMEWLTLLSERVI